MDERLTKPVTTRHSEQMSGKLHFLLLIGLTLCLARMPAFGSDKSPEGLLRKVSEAYASLDSFYFDASETTITRSGDIERRNESRIVTAAGHSGRFRVVSDHPVDGGIVAFDGATTWIHLAVRNQFTKVNGAMIEGPESPGLMRLKNRFVSRYANITERLRSAEFGLPEALEIDGCDVECRVVKASYDPPRGLAAERIIRKYWIANDRPLIYQENSSFEASNATKGKSISVSQEIVFHRATVGKAVSEDAFIPRIPEDAVLVVELEDAVSSPIGRTAVPFEAVDLDGAPHRSEDLKGQVVLLDFWASWCIPCRLDLLRVEALHQELSDQGLVVLGVTDEPREKARRFVTERGFTFPTLSDEEGVLFRGYEVRTIPTAVIVGRDGRVSSYLVGSHSGDDLREAVLGAGLE